MLGNLGFLTGGQGSGQDKNIKISVPSWRHDIEGKADIVEEIVRIVGVDRIPRDAIRPRRSPAQAGAHADPGAHAAKPGARLPRAVWSRRSPGRSFPGRRRELFGGGEPRAGARQPDRIRALRHAAEPDPGAGCGRAKQRRPRFCAMSLCSRWDRFSRATGRRINSPPPPACAVGLPRAPASEGTGRRRPRKWMHSTPRPTRSLSSLRRAHPAHGAAGGARRSRLVPSRPQRHHCDRSAERARTFRRAASACDRGARCARSRWSPSR